MSQSPSSSSEPPVALMHIQAPQETIDFYYPQVGVMKQSIAEIFQGREYPLVILPGNEVSVIVDVGANIGATAMLFHANFPRARVLCYEPSPSHLQFLHRNFASRPNVEIYPFGLLDRDHSAKLYRGRDFPMQSSIIRAGEQTDYFEPAELRRASEELDRRGVGDISILKLDTEGCELPILRDLGPRVARIDLAYIEYHSEADRRAIDALLAEHMIVAMMSAKVPHRGMVVYISRRLVQKYPGLNELEVKLGSDV